MKRRSMNEFKPFLSVIIIIAVLFGILFCKMEIRRIGYSILKMAQIEKKLREQRRTKELQLAELTRPERVESVAQNKFTLRKADSKQVILLSGTRPIRESENHN